jgi:hypothetical protein
MQFSGLLQTWKKENAELERLLGHRLQYGRDRKATIIPQSQILELCLKRGISRLTAERETAQETVRNHCPREPAQQHDNTSSLPSFERQPF